MKILTNTSQIRDYSGEPSVIYSNPVTTVLRGHRPPEPHCRCCCFCNDCCVDCLSVCECGCDLNEDRE